MLVQRHMFASSDLSVPCHLWHHPPVIRAWHALQRAILLEEDELLETAHSSAAAEGSTRVSE